MNRRSFLRGILAAGAAPAIVKASALMPARGIILPTLEETLKYTAHHHYGKVMTSAEFVKVLWPGISVWYKEQYDQIPHLSFTKES